MAVEIVLATSTPSALIDLPRRSFLPWTVKRSLDLAVSVVLLILCASVFLTVALIIKLTSRGPVFYRHARRGRSGATFNVLKFRTMQFQGDRVLADHFASNPKLRAEWQLSQKLKQDPRVTPVGKWLRRFSLDELPQLLNVIAGDMSLVGPRPIVDAEVRKYGPRFDFYQRVRPGITGLWQVSGRSDTTYQQRTEFDEYYVRNWSILLDLQILVRTVRVVVSGNGAY
jgi:Undecaprenyl-phosphate galactose phosphotransferase WbaP